MQILQGLIDLPKPIRIYIENKSDPPWYIYDADSNQRQPIHQEALVGRFVRLQVAEKKDDPDGALKLDLTVETDDEVYIVRSGCDTHFSQSLVWLLDGMAMDQLSGLLALVPKAGDRTAFAKIYDPQRREFIYRERPSDRVDWNMVRQDAIAKVNGDRRAMTQEEALQLWQIAAANGWDKDSASSMLAAMGYGGLLEVPLCDRATLRQRFSLSP